MGFRFRVNTSLYIIRVVYLLYHQKIEVQFYFIKFLVYLWLHCIRAKLASVQPSHSLSISLPILCNQFSLPFVKSKLKSTSIYITSLTTELRSKNRPDPALPADAPMPHAPTSSATSAATRWRVGPPPATGTSDFLLLWYRLLRSFHFWWEISGFIWSGKSIWFCGLLCYYPYSLFCWFCYYPSASVVCWKMLVLLILGFVVCCVI